MKRIKRFLPYLGVALSLCLPVLAFLENRNPMMGFLTSRVSSVFIGAQCLVCILLAVQCFLHQDESGESIPRGRNGKNG